MCDASRCGSVAEDGLDASRGEHAASLEELELDHERVPDHVRVLLAHQIGRGARGAAGGEHVDVVVGIESRGFIFGGALAARLNASFVPARKPGKLPASVDKVSYTTEYSTAELEIHKESFKRGARVVIVDDVLATGGTAKAAASLVTTQGGEVLAYAFVIELEFLKGRDVLQGSRVESVLSY